MLNLPHKNGPTCLIRRHLQNQFILHFKIVGSLQPISKNINYLYMCQTWSQVKLYLEVLKNDEHEMHIKNIFKPRL